MLRRLLDGEAACASDHAMVSRLLGREIETDDGAMIPFADNGLLVRRERPGGVSVYCLDPDAARDVQAVADHLERAVRQFGAAGTAEDGR